MDSEKLSVVIATLGGPSLRLTIQSLMDGSFLPDEILICIPKDHAHKAVLLASDIVKVVATEVKGQVRQRAFGFTQVQNELVMQLDDDILFEKNGIEQLVTQIQTLGKGNALAPVYYNSETKTCIHQLQNGFIKNLFDVIICGTGWGAKKMGVLTSIGLNYGVDDAHTNNKLVETQWLPGGCVICYKDDLVTDDFFPFTGKAYCEDVYHSYYRKLRSIRLWVMTGVRAYIDQPVTEITGPGLEKVNEIRRHFVKLAHGPLWRLSLYELFTKGRSRMHTSGGTQ